MRVLVIAMLLAAGRAAGEPTHDFLGVLLAGETVELAPKSEGRIETVRVKPGDRVARGAVVAVLDVRPLRRQLAIAQAALAEAHRRVTRRLPLTRGLVAISSDELGTARLQMLEARARVQQLREALVATEVRAPFGGVVSARYADAGAIVGPGHPVVRLITEEAPRVRFAVPEDRIEDIAVGARVRIELKTPRLILVGVVETVAPEIDSAARMFFVVATLQAPPRSRWSSGRVARVAPITASARDTLVD